jgi:hypothetical protein
MGFNEFSQKSFKKVFPTCHPKSCDRIFFSGVPKMGQLKQPRIWSSVPTGQKVATRNLEISPSSVLLYKKSKNCARKKEKKIELQVVPL